MFRICSKVLSHPYHLLVCGSVVKMSINYLRSLIIKLFLILLIVLMLNDKTTLGLYVARERFQLYELLPQVILNIRLWLTITAVNLLAISELTGPYSGRTKIYIKNDRLRSVAVIFGFLSLFTITVEIYKIIITLQFT